MAFSMPASIFGSTTMLASEVAETSLAMTPFTESPPLRYGTIVNDTPVASLIISPTKSGVEPLPAVDQVALPPCALAQAINSAMFEAGTLGLTTMVDGAAAIMPIGTRSESLYGMSFNSRLLVTVFAAPTRKV